MLIVYSVIMSPALPHPNDISTLHRKKLHSLLIEGAAADSSRPLIISLVTSLHLSGGLQSQPYTRRNVRRFLDADKSVWSPQTGKFPPAHRAQDDNKAHSRLAPPQLVTKTQQQCSSRTSLSFVCCMYVCCMFREILPDAEIVWMMSWCQIAHENVDKWFYFYTK